MREKTISDLIDLTQDQMSDVNNLIMARLGSHVDMVPDIATHIILSGGKRLRPMLTIACGQMVAADRHAINKLAACVEFMHTATLLHDDVVDESDMRRGQKTARLIWGNPASVLVGDFLLGQAFLMMVETGCQDVLLILSKAASVIAEGEVHQLTAAQDLTTTAQTYMQVIGAKTASLFAAACEVGPAVASNKVQQKLMQQFGYELGICFQLVDDALDFSGSAEALGKNVGDDLREGKMTLPIIYALEKMDNTQKVLMKDIITKVDGLPDDTTIAHAVRLVREFGGDTGTMQKAKHHAQRAKQALSKAPPCPQKDALCDVVDFCVSRSN